MGYEESRTRSDWNLRKPNRFPEVIVEAQTQGDVVEAVHLARRRDLRVKVRATGHSRSASFLRDGGMMLDVSQLTEILIDPVAAIAIVEPGVRGGDLNTDLLSHQLFFPTAHDGRVGISGFVMAGGFGWCPGRYGVACANLAAIEVVSPKGDVIYADDNANADYIWAARGAGPALFGVVTKLHLTIHPIPVIRSSAYLYPMAVWEHIWSWLIDVSPSFSRDLEVLVATPTMSSDPVHPGPFVSVDGTAMSDSVTGALDALTILDTCPALEHAELRDFARPRTVGDLAGWGTSDRRVPDLYFGMDNMWTDSDPAELIPALRMTVQTMPNELCNMFGALWRSRGPVPNSAFSSHGRLLLNLSAAWRSQSEQASCLNWATTNMARLQPLASGMALQDEELLLRPATNFLPSDSLARMASLRSEHDPQRRFHDFAVGVIDPGRKAE